MGNFVPQGHLAISGNTFNCYDWEGRCYWCPVGRGRDSAEHYADHRITPPHDSYPNYAAQSASSAKAEEPCTLEHCLPSLIKGQLVLQGTITLFDFLFTIDILRLCKVRC